jgi:glycosyltransferase involved in cell wall biosynthesis
LPEIIEAAKIILSKFPAKLFYIAGRKGDGFELANQLIQKEGLTKNVILLGEISEKEKIEYMQQCLIYLQPSRYEGFGLAIAEAMACGAAILSSNVGEVKNVVGDAGKLIEGYKPNDIAIAINELLDDEQLRLSIGKKARIRIVDNFSFDVRKKDIKQLIEN